MIIRETYQGSEPDMKLEVVSNDQDSAVEYFLKTTVEYKAVSKQEFDSLNSGKIVSKEVELSEDGDSLLYIEEPSGISLFVNGENVSDPGRIGLVQEYIQLHTNGKQLNLDF